MDVILKEDGMPKTSTETENIAISWALGERRIQVYNDRHVGFMYKTSHEETIPFNLEGGQAAELYSVLSSNVTANIGHRRSQRQI